MESRARELYAPTSPTESAICLFHSMLVTFVCMGVGDGVGVEVGVGAGVGDNGALGLGIGVAVGVDVGSVVGEADGVGSGGAVGVGAKVGVGDGEVVDIGIIILSPNMQPNPIVIVTRMTMIKATLISGDFSEGKV